MSDIHEIKQELSGNTNFDKDHEDELFARISQIEEQERDGQLVTGLNRADYILIAVMFIVLGILPVIWYAVMYF